jgi:hypothetical protein
VLLVAVALGALAASVPVVDGRSTGAFLAHAFVCSVRGGCAQEDAALRAAYGERDAELVRRLAPGLVYEPGTRTLPVDWRECRSPRCSSAPDERDLDAHRARGAEATAFTHVVRRDGETFVQYWLYYPDSTTTWGGAAGIWNRVRRFIGRGPRYPGHHADDWESVQLRIDRRGVVWARASSHHGYQTCKQRRCRNRWARWHGWSRVSRGSHAGHLPLRPRVVGAPVRADWSLPRLRVRDEPQLPGRDLRERTTTGPGLRLVPLETIDRSSYRPLDPGITPPWRKRVWTDPTSDSTG